MITQPNWQKLASDVEVPAKPAGLWTRAVDYVAGPRKLRIVVKPGATWTLSKGLTPGADGDVASSANSTDTASALFPSVLLGALIGKVGGSAADNTAQIGSPPAHPSTLPTPFAVGSFCIVDLAADKHGPLFLTMNDVVKNFNLHDGKLVVDIEYAI